MKTFATFRRKPVAGRLAARPAPGRRGRDAGIRHILHAPRLQAKLTVGAPNDAFEREADRTADAVLRMPEGRLQRVCAECEEEMQRQPAEQMEEEELQRQPAETMEEEEEVQAKELPGEVPAIDRGLEGRIQALRGAGQPPPPAERGFFEPRFGTDFGSVRVHAGGEAAQLARAVRARAFTLGRDVVFGAGEYAPETAGGRRLIAHELTHVVQQGGGPSSASSRGATVAGGGERIQRKIVVGGKDYTPTAKYLTWLETNYSKAMVEFINGMHNGGSSPDYSFASFEEMGTEVKIRYNAIQGIEEVHAGCCSYPSGGGTGKLDSTYWDKVGAYKFTVKSPLPSGKDASDAVEAIFKSGAGTELECNSTTVAIQYRAMLRTLGKAAFNKKFPAGAGVIISPHHAPPAGVALHPIWEKKLYKEVTITGASDLLPGDWVYFKNIDDYGAKHPGGFWTGEHAIYLGGGKFRGFGLAEKTEAEINAELLAQYNAGLPAADKKVLADVPGLRDYARRPVVQEILK